MRKNFYLDEKIYNVCDIEKVLRLSVNQGMTIGNNKGVYYFNIPCAFDIETTSFYIDKDTGRILDYAEKIRKQRDNINYEPEKAAIMYHWQFGINGRVIIGRTWPEFVSMLDYIAEYLHLSKNQKLIIYVHNLDFEFQFMRKWLCWSENENDFLYRAKLEPIYVTTANFIEFRCSLKLSNYSLANLANQLQTYKNVKKLVGKLDYSLIRNSKTALTADETAYCVNDVRVVMCYIQEQIENEHGIQNIPLTQTGRVRKYCRDATLYLTNHHEDKAYRKLIKSLRINDMSEFQLIQQCFQGGFTHANSYYSGITLSDVSSYDFTSSYPYVMVSEKFPMSAGVKIAANDLTAVDFNYWVYPSINGNKRCSIMNITFINLIQRETHENPLSQSKCEGISPDKVVNNGRVVSCSWCNVSLTNIDFVIMKKYYKWDKIIIREFYGYHLQYLPTKLVTAILDLYERKTSLKGVKGMEVEYLRSKEMINSVYGMSVTNPLRDKIYIDENQEWQKKHYEDWELALILDRENEKRNRFLFYLWGVYVTAYARRNLFTAISALEWDYVYSDTDSVKILHRENHSEYFSAYDSLVREKLNKAAEYHKINPERFSPKTKEGKIKTLGLWDYEGTYRYFKTLGAKRYCVAWHNETTNIAGKEYPMSITVAGLNKKSAIPYLFDEIAGGDIMKVFDAFKEGLHIPPEFTGKSTHCYIHYPQRGVICDYQGNIAEYDEKSSVHLEPVSYDLSLAADYIKYLREIQTKIM